MQFRGGISELMRQASRIQRKVDETREALKNECVVATGANDKVKVTANYARELVRVEIDPEFLADDRDLALDALVATANAALKLATEAMDKEISKASGGLKLPGVT